MPAATTKAELRALSEKEFSKLRTLIDAMPRDQAMRKREGDTSIKDVIGHRAHWIGLFLGWHAEGQAGHVVHFPGPGYKWSDLRAFNADLRAQQAALTWEQVARMLDDNHAALLAFVDGLDDVALYGGPMQGGNNAWTTGRWAEAAGPSHYRSAAKWIRACLRADARAPAGAAGPDPVGE